MESVQCNTWTTVTVTIRGTSRDKRYKEIGLESLQLCHRYRNLCSFCKFYIIEYPHHFSRPVPVRHFLHHQKYCKQFLFQNKTYFFQKFFPHLLLRVAVLTVKFESSEVLVFLKIVFWNSSEQPLVTLLIVKIKEDSNS